MDLLVYLRGMILGLAIAAPVGPIGVLCIRRTLTAGRLYGLLSGIGAATADAVYGSIAAFGLTVVSRFLVGQQLWLQVIGGCFLCYLGIRTWRSKAADSPPQGAGKARKLLGAYTSTLALTLTNPMTIISFVSIFAGMGIAAGSHVASMLIVFGVFCGSALWWLLLSVCVGHFREKMDTKLLGWINRFSAIIMLGFGVFALYQAMN
ncbi:LysE family translocator [Sporolactobacillus laevolacticus]|uniref:Lysine transporter LysE n=1 Tax=Sporolactobacillus laevolacticus DSM 442 TaxID=1395513 RepID=V6IUV8_9BACL|nr:LysE family translocator [Sporolactobacillus laevolacticus]EST10830.1 lysine transporter LysE [Sporolactobacillus laevolacticus DSM 442]